MMKKRIGDLFESRKGRMDYLLHRDFIDNGIVTFPCKISSFYDIVHPFSVRRYETLFSAVEAFCMGVLKKLPSYPDEYIRNIDQAISRYEALKTLTSNVAYMWHEEDRMGSISLGKIANFTVFDRDFMHDDFADIEKASCLATIVDGEEVYRSVL